MKAMATTYSMRLPLSLAFFGVVVVILLCANKHEVLSHFILFLLLSSYLLYYPNLLAAIAVCKLPCMMQSNYTFHSL